MERYALVRHLQRQRQLVRRMAPGQPLSAYVAQHRLLPAAIGPMPEAPAPASLPRRFVPGEDARAVQSMDAVLPTLEPPALNTVEKRSAALAEQNTAQQPAQEMMKHERSMPNIVATQHTPAPPRHSIQVENRNSASVLKMAQAEEQAAREQVQWLEQPNAKAEQPTLPEPARVEQNARALDVPAFDMQPVNVAAALAPAAASQDVPASDMQPVNVATALAPAASQQELPARRRARIEEWPLPLPGNSSAQVKRTNAEMIHRPEDARHLAKAEQKTETEHEADALFTSSTPGRSPQEWFALLTQAEQKPQPATSVNVAAALAPVAGQVAGARAAATFTTSAQFKRVSHQPMREPHPMQSRSTRTMSEQVAVPRLLASAPGETNAAQFIPAQQRTNSQSLPPDPVARSSDGRHSRADVENAGDAVAVSGDTPAAEPLSMRARRFLKPLVGFDPADARIHRDPAAERFASAQKADAVTVGDDISLAAGYASDEPETLGLLAHELTHVARHHEPRAVPPILNGRGDPATDVQATPNATRDAAVSASDTSLASAGEEELAEQVERQVILRASEQAEMSATSSPTGVARAFPPQVARESGLQQPRDALASWGSLPAPWEPLPDWLASSSSLSTDGTDVPVGLPQGRQPQPAYSARSDNGQRNATSTSAPRGAGAGAASAQNAPVAQRAGRERSLDGANEQASQPEPPWKQQLEPEPDLDKLARQVYAVLKRKLDVERRRMS